MKSLKKVWARLKSMVRWTLGKMGVTHWEAEGAFEGRLRALRREYSGLWGHKVFWLALLTLAPFFALTRVFKLPVAFNLPLLVFVVYHGTGLYVWALVRQVSGPDSDLHFDKDEREAHVRRAWRVRWLNARLSLLVLVLIAGQTVLLLDFGGHRLGLPVKVYRALALPVPAEAYAAELNDIVDSVAAGNSLRPDPCAAIGRWTTEHKPGEDEDEGKVLVCKVRMPAGSGYRERVEKFKSIVAEVDRYPGLEHVCNNKGERGDLESYWARPGTQYEVVVSLWVDEEDGETSLEERQREARLTIDVVKLSDAP